MRNLNLFLILAILLISKNRSNAGEEISTYNYTPNSGILYDYIVYQGSGNALEYITAENYDVKQWSMETSLTNYKTYYVPSIATDGIKNCIASASSNLGKIEFGCSEVTGNTWSTPYSIGHYSNSDVSLATDGKYWCVTYLGVREDIGTDPLSPILASRIWLSCCDKDTGSKCTATSDWTNNIMLKDWSYQAPRIATDGRSWCISYKGAAEATIYIRCSKGPLGVSPASTTRHWGINDNRSKAWGKTLMFSSNTSGKKVTIFTLGGVGIATNGKLWCLANQGSGTWDPGGAWRGIRTIQLTCNNSPDPMTPWVNNKALPGRKQNKNTQLAACKGAGWWAASDVAPTISTDGYSWVVAYKGNVDSHIFVNHTTNNKSLLDKKPNSQNWMECRAGDKNTTGRTVYISNPKKCHYAGETGQSCCNGLEAKVTCEVTKKYYDSNMKLSKSDLYKPIDKNDGSYRYKYVMSVAKYITSFTSAEITKMDTKYKILSNLYNAFKKFYSSEKNITQQMTEKVGKKVKEAEGANFSTSDKCRKIFDSLFVKGTTFDTNQCMHYVSVYVYYQFGTAIKKAIDENGHIGTLRKKLDKISLWAKNEDWLCQNTTVLNCSKRRLIYSNFDSSNKHLYFIDPILVNPSKLLTPKPGSGVTKYPDFSNGTREATKPWLQIAKYIKSNKSFNNYRGIFMDKDTTKKVDSFNKKNPIKNLTNSEKQIVHFLQLYSTYNLKDKFAGRSKAIELLKLYVQYYVLFKGPKLIDRITSDINDSLQVIKLSEKSILVPFWPGKLKKKALSEAQQQYMTSLQSLADGPSATQSEFQGLFNSQNNAASDSIFTGGNLEATGDQGAIKAFDTQSGDGQKKIKSDGKAMKLAKGISGGEAVFNNMGKVKKATISSVEDHLKQQGNNITPSKLNLSEDSKLVKSKVKGSNSREKGQSKGMEHKNKSGQPFNSYMYNVPGVGHVKLDVSKKGMLTPAEQNNILEHVRQKDYKKKAGDSLFVIISSTYMKALADILTAKKKKKNFLMQTMPVLGN